MSRGLAVAIALAFSVPGAAGVSFSTWLGGPGDDALAGAAVLPDGSIVLAGTVPGGPLELRRPVGARRGRGEGIVLRLSPDARRVLAILRLDGPVSDLDADAEGRIALTGGFGTARLTPALEGLWASEKGGQGARVAAMPGGSAILLAGKTVTLLDARGRAGRSWKVPASYAEDVACDARTRLLFVTGFHNRRGRVPGQKTNPVQVAYVYAYDAQGEKVWTAYDWKGQEVAQRRLMADTRGYRLALGADGKLYVAGESAGGNSMWSRQSQDLDAAAPLAKPDKFQNPYNTAANHITFVGRLDPRTGALEGGTFLLARLSSGRGNTIRPRALAADERGRVYVAGASASHPPLSNGGFGRFEGGGAFFVVFDRSFHRVLATKFCSGTALAVGVGEGTIVAAGEGKDHLPPTHPLQAEPGGGKDGWAVVFAR
ncbi:MAG: hypothetical protein ACLF0G_02125 [Candidatus Brocadiia bacterium]